MRVSILPLLSTTLLALPSSCAPSTAATSDIVLPNRWVRYDLEVPINSTSALERRKDVTVCEYIGAAASCLVIASNTYQLVNYLANVIRSAAANQSCGKFTGTYLNVKYRYQANGKNCDTTAEQDTIAGAIDHHLKTVDNNELCATECLDLTHGGTWDGYLLIGPGDSFEDSMYCGPTLDFDNCSSGGKGDFN